MSTLVRIPMVQSVGGLIDSLRDHNEKVRERRYARVLLTSYNTPQQIDALAATLFNAYRAVRLEMAVNYILDRIEAGLLRAQSPGLGQSGRRDWLHRRILERMGSLPWLPQAPPDTSAAAQVPVWHWGTRPVEHSVRVLLDLLTRAQQLGRLIPKVEPDDPAYLRPDFLSDEWARAFELLENTAQLRDRDADHWSKQAEAVQHWLGTGHGKSRPPQGAHDWLDQAIDGWQREPSVLAERYARDIARVLIELGPCVTALLQLCAGDELPERTLQAKELESLYGYFVRDGEKPSVGAVVGRLLAFEVVQEALGGRGTMPEEAIDFIQISAHGASAFGGYSAPADKLAGVQLAHFGAFYRKSWRANDWMWGRLDAVRRLVRIVLDPEMVRVKALTFAPGQRAKEMARRIADIALGGSQEARDKLPPETRAELQSGFTLEAIEAELGYLDHPHDVVPEFLETSVEAVCRRVELDVLQQELPLVADAVQADQAENARLSPMAQSFLIASGRWPPPVPPNPLHALLEWYARGPAAPSPVPAHKVRALLAQCQFGREKIEDDVGTDRLTLVAAQTTTLAISTMTQQDGWLIGFGRMMGLLRTPALLFYLFTRSALLGSKTGLAFNVTVFIAGVAIVATAVLANVSYPSWLFLVAISALVAGLMFLVMRIGWMLRILLMIVAAAAIGWFAYVNRPLPPLAPAVWITIAVVEVLWLTFALLYRVPRSRPRPRGKGQHD